MEPIMLPVLCHNDDTILFEELGIKCSYAHLEEVQYIFFKIDYACGNVKDGKEYTEIVSGEDSYVVNLTFEEFKQRINFK